MNSNSVHERNIEEFKQIPDIKTIVEQSWGKQGETILHNKLLPRGSKNALLIQALGSFGPGLDVLMRALIPQMLVLHIGEKTRMITEMKIGFLHRYVKSKIRSENRNLLDLINKWFVNLKSVKQFEHAYRTLRWEVLSSQVKTLYERPQLIVSIFICLILYLKYI